MTSMKKTIIIALLMAVVTAPASNAWIFGKKKKKEEKKYEKTEVVVAQPKAEQPKSTTVTITDAPKQLYGEWTVETVRKKAFVSDERAYIYLDFNNHQFYGNNGCNVINGTFTQKGNNISFKDVITTMMECPNNNGRNLLKTLNEVQKFQVTTLYNIERLELQNSKGTQLMVLKRQNLDVLNGAWVVKEMENENVLSKNIRIVIDVNMLTLHANTGCNIINGIVTLDPSKDFAIQFEDLRSSGNKCESIDIETDCLLALENTESYKRINDNEYAFLAGDGASMMVITRLDLKR